MEKMLDISRWQDTLDPAKAKAAGITTIICRATYGTGKDIRWDRFTPAIKASGIRLGAYGFATWHYRSHNGGSLATARSLMIKQTDALIALAKAAGVDSWCAVDQELEKGMVMGLTKADNTTLLMEALERIRAAGLHPCIYCSASWVKAYIDTSRCTTPIWAAYYYADPDDPDFEGCTPLSQLRTDWGEYLQGLGDQVICWQFGRIGYGSRYGVASPNVDKDWLYRQPENKEEKPMEFTPITGKQLRCTSAESPKCETFSGPDINASLGVLELGKTYPITAQGSTVEVAGLTGTWYKILVDGAEVYCLELPDGRCVVEDAPEETNPDLTEIREALARLEQATAKAAMADKMLRATRAAAEAFLAVIDEEV